jgi:S-adenosylmethionine:tRNA ribosyltransferase-isomerase
VKRSDFHFDFPSELIATEAIQPPSSARVLVYDRATQKRDEIRFLEILDRADPQDLWVFNRTEVIPARFLVRRPSGIWTEALYLKGNSEVVEVWLRGKWRAGDFLQLKNDRKIRLLSREGKGALLEISGSEMISYLQQFGEMPIPPYIRQERERAQGRSSEKSDREFYQNPFSHKGALLSSAAPTASLHCDHLFQEKFKAKGFRSVEVELEIGLGTFAPMEVEEISEHPMHSENYRVPQKAWEEIQATKKSGGKIIAVGTTVVRSLESFALREIQSEDLHSTDLFIRPGFPFQVVDQLITNFHQPESTLVMLVASFLEPGSVNPQHSWKSLYQTAVDQKMRLFSYGDAMWIR